MEYKFSEEIVTYPFFMQHLLQGGCWQQGNTSLMIMISATYAVLNICYLFIATVICLPKRRGVKKVLKVAPSPKKLPSPSLSPTTQKKASLKTANAKTPKSPSPVKEVTVERIGADTKPKKTDKSMKRKMKDPKKEKVDKEHAQATDELHKDSQLALNQDEDSDDEEDDTMKGIVSLQQDPNVISNQE
ncbi:unnamed protein product [Thelazia callipaeda]|uniref:G_PROTEIN_RECEP_F1_2 domain-containing protein n=1 Tax=Thelazia callipaeda TaxID=103827 RepID=A0A158RBC2_THECL|nr:unnamed protein product [Thelazia callipaeda]